MTRTQHVRRMIDNISPDDRRMFRQTPLIALEKHKIEVRSVPSMTSSRGSGGMCDGMSFTTNRTILYSQTESRRENFTLLHEFAHLLIDADDFALFWLAEQSDPASEIEKLCDEIAACLLIPESEVDEIVMEGPIAGRHLLELFRRTEASQIVCAIALSRRLSCNGAVVLSDRLTRKIVFSAISGEPAIFPFGGQQIPDGHPLLSLEINDERSSKSFWTTPWGETSDYYLSATASAKRTYSVFSEIDLWNTVAFHAPIQLKEVKQRPVQFVSCDCGYAGLSKGWPCTDCGRHYCPRCQSCDCIRRAKLTKTCSKCFLNVPRADLMNGICSGCR